MRQAKNIFVSRQASVVFKHKEKRVMYLHIVFFFISREKSYIKRIFIVRRISICYKNVRGITANFCKWLNDPTEELPYYQQHRDQRGRRGKGRKGEKGGEKEENRKIRKEKKVVLEARKGNIKQKVKYFPLICKQGENSVTIDKLKGLFSIKKIGFLR